MSAALQIASTPAALQGAASFQDRLGLMLSKYLAGFDLLGRLHVMQAVKKQSGKVVKLNTLTIAPQIFDEGKTVVMGFESVPFQGAIDRLRNLTGFTKVAFDGLAARYKMQAITVAGVSDVRLIDAIQMALANVVAQGGTEKDFERVVNSLTDAAGVERLAQVQLETVFQTNVMTAYANGRFEQMRDPAVLIALPAWQYRTVGDDRVRPAHRALEGFTAKWDDGVWRRIYPPCGFNCRCTVIPLLASEAPKGWDSPGEPRIPLAAASVPDPGFGGARLGI